MKLGRVGFGCAPGKLGCPLTKRARCVGGRPGPLTQKKKIVRSMVALLNQTATEFGRWLLDKSHTAGCGRQGGTAPATSRC